MISDPSDLSVFWSKLWKERNKAKKYFFFNFDGLPDQKSDRIALKKGKIQENMILCTILVYHFKANLIQILKKNVIETENKPTK